MNIIRRKSKKIKCGSIYIGGDSPITIQSMTTTDTRNINETISQIKVLEKHGCEIVRVAVPDLEAAEAVEKIKKNITIPLVADIHFDYRVALKCIENGIDKLRINPGNIGDKERVKKIVSAAKERQIPIRIGVNAGSLDKKLLDKYEKVTPEAMVDSALEHIEILECLDFNDIIVSLKASDIKLTLDSYELLSDKVNYPFHIGITEAGTIWKGTIKSSIGIGSMLLDGIGDTIRVSLTGDPVEEIKVCKEILQSLKIRQFGVSFISCPTCGRCQVNLVNLANELEKKTVHINKNITVAVMGCAVNGPGEAREADIGIAGGKGTVLLFKKGKIIKKINEEEAVNILIKEIENLE